MNDNELVAKMITDHFNNLGYTASSANEFGDMTTLIGIDYPNHWGKDNDDVYLYDVVLMVNTNLHGVSVVFGPKHRDYDPGDPDFLIKIEKDLKPKDEN